MRTNRTLWAMAFAVGMAWATASTASTARAETLTAQEAVNRAMGESPALRAARADVDSAKASVRVADGARGAVMNVYAQGEHQESFNVAGNGVASSSQQGLSSGVAATVQSDLGTSVTVGVDTSVQWRETNLDPTRTALFQIGPIYSSSVSVDVRQPLLRGSGAVETLGPRREAQARRTAADYAAQESESQLALDVIQAHWELWYAQEALALADEALTLAKTQHNEAHLRFSQLGELSGTEVLRYASEQALAARNRASAAAEVESKAVALAALVGVSGAEAQALRAEASAPDPGQPAPLSLLEQAAQEHSSELLSLEAEVDAAKASLKTAASADQARLDLVASGKAGVLFNDATLSTFQLPGNRPAFSGTLGIELELPLSDSQQAAEHDKARADHEAAMARYDETVRSIVAEVATLRSTITTANERVALSKEAVDIAGRLAESERQRLQLGTGTALQLVEAQQTAREAALELRRAQADYAASVARLAHLTGSLIKRQASDAAEGAS